MPLSMKEFNGLMEQIDTYIDEYVKKGNDFFETEGLTRIAPFDKVANAIFEQVVTHGKPLSDQHATLTESNEAPHHIATLYSRAIQEIKFDSPAAKAAIQEWKNAAKNWSAASNTPKPDLKDLIVKLREKGAIEEARALHNIARFANRVAAQSEINKMPPGNVMISTLNPRFIPERGLTAAKLDEIADEMIPLQKKQADNGTRLKEIDTKIQKLEGKFFKRSKDLKNIEGLKKEKTSLEAENKDLQKQSRELGVRLMRDRDKPTEFGEALKSALVDAQFSLKFEDAYVEKDKEATVKFTDEVAGGELFRGPTVSPEQPLNAEKIKPVSALKKTKIQTDPLEEARIKAEAKAEGLMEEFYKRFVPEGNEIVVDIIQNHDGNYSIKINSDSGLPQDKGDTISLSATNEQLLDIENNMHEIMINTFMATPNNTQWAKLKTVCQEDGKDAHALVINAYINNPTESNLDALKWVFNKEKKRMYEPLLSNPTSKNFELLVKVFEYGSKDAAQYKYDSYSKFKLPYPYDLMAAQILKEPTEIELKFFTDIWKQDHQEPSHIFLTEKTLELLKSSQGDPNELIGNLIICLWKDHEQFPNLDEEASKKFAEILKNVLKNPSIDKRNKTDLQDVLQLLPSETFTQKIKSGAYGEAAQIGAKNVSNTFEGALQRLLDFPAQTWNSAKQAFPGALEMAKSSASNLWETVKSAASNAWSKVSSSVFGERMEINPNATSVLKPPKVPNVADALSAPKNEGSATKLESNLEQKPAALFEDPEFTQTVENMERKIQKLASSISTPAKADGADKADGTQMDGVKPKSAAANVSATWTKSAPKSLEKGLPAFSNHRSKDASSQNQSSVPKNAETTQASAPEPAKKDTAVIPKGKVEETKKKFQ